MPSGTPLPFQPTFPLDDREIRRRTKWLLWTHPGRLLLMAGAVALGAILSDGASLGWMLSGALSVLGVVGWGVSNRAELEAKAVEALVAESNEAQDQLLADEIAALRNRERNAYAIALGRLALLKRHIEEALHAEGRPLTSEVEKREHLVDRVCAEAISRFKRLEALESRLGAALTSVSRDQLDALEKERTNLLHGLHQAYGSLFETLESLRRFERLSASSLEGGASDSKSTGGADKASEEADATFDSLAVVLERLHEENELSRKVEARLGGAVGTTDSSEARQTPSLLPEPPPLPKEGPEWIGGDLDAESGKRAQSE